MRGDSRSALLEVGDRLLLTSGYAGTGLSEIMASAGVPKGSFYHWFTSKREYVAQVAERHYGEHDEVLRAWAQRPGPPAERLVGYFRQVRDAYAVALTAGADPAAAESAAGPAAGSAPALERSGREHHAMPVGCLLGALALEVADTEPVLRERLEALFARWRARLADILVQVQQQGSIAGDDAARTAGLLLDAWEGALMRMRLTRSVQAIDDFLAFTLPLAVPAVLAVPASGPRPA